MTERAIFEARAATSLALTLLLVVHEDCEPARRAIFAFVERATGAPLPPLADQKDAAPSLVRTPARPSA
jgi:hypothetical protein